MTLSFVALDTKINTLSLLMLKLFEQHVVMLLPLRFIIKIMS